MHDLRVHREELQAPRSPQAKESSRYYSEMEDCKMRYKIAAVISIVLCFIFLIVSLYIFNVSQPVKIYLNNTPDGIFCADNGYAQTDGESCIRYEYATIGKIYSPDQIVKYITLYGTDNITIIKIKEPIKELRLKEK